MKTVIGVRLRRPGKVYYFNPGNKKINKGEFVIVETTFGQEYAGIFYISNVFNVSFIFSYIFI